MFLLIHTYQHIISIECYLTKKAIICPILQILEICRHLKKVDQCSVGPTKPIGWTYWTKSNICLQLQTLNTSKHHDAMQFSPSSIKPTSPLYPFMLAHHLIFYIRISYVLYNSPWFRPLFICLAFRRVVIVFVLYSLSYVGSGDLPANGNLYTIKIKTADSK